MPPDSDQENRLFLSDVDALSEVNPDTYGDPWSLTKPEWVVDSWRKAAGGRLQKRQKEFYASLRSAFELYRNKGLIDDNTDNGRLFGLLRPGPVSKSNLKTNKKVQRSLPWTSAITFADPFYKMIGTHLMVLIAEFNGVDADPKWHSHLGEEFVYMIEGAIEIQWLVPAEDGESFKCDEQRDSVVLDADQSHRRSSWFKSEVPHRAVLKSKAAKALVFFSDPLGAHTILRRPKFEMQGLGARLVDRNEDTDQLWATFSGIGARIERIRRIRGWSSTLLAKLAEIQPSHLSRIESGGITVSIDTAAILAANLEVPLTEILPDDVLISTRGCYLNRSESVWSMLTDLDRMPDETAHHLHKARDDGPKGHSSAQPEYRVQIPFTWKNYFWRFGNDKNEPCVDDRRAATIDNEVTGLLVLPSGSPRAKSLLPLIMYVCEKGLEIQTKKTLCTPYVRKMADHNFRVIEQARDANHYWSFAGNLVIYIREGSIRLRVARTPDMQLFPSLHREIEAKRPSPWFHDVVLEAGDLLHLNCEHLHRFEIERHQHCVALCVLNRPHVSTAIEVAPSKLLKLVLPVRFDDEKFMNEVTGIAAASD